MAINLDNPEIFLVGSALGDEIYKDPQVVARGYDRLMARYQYLEEMTAQFTEKHPESIDAIAGMTFNDIRPYLRQVEAAADRVRGGHTRAGDYNPKEIGFAMAFIMQAYEQMEELMKDNEQ